MFGIYVWKVNQDETTKSLVNHVTYSVKEVIELIKGYKRFHGNDNSVNIRVIKAGKTIYSVIH